MRFIINNLRANRVNLLMNDYVAGLPSPLAFLGLAESIGRDLGVQHWHARIIPILHSVHVSEGRTKPEMENKSGRFSPIEIVEDLVGTIDVSLIIDLPGCKNADDVGSRLLCKRIGGGIIKNKELQIDSTADDGSSFKKVGRGYAMVRPDQEERRIISSGNLSQIERIGRILFPEVREPGRGWIIPVAVGHRLLEDPDTAPKRSRSRSPDIPHVFVEPCVGIAELISVRNSRLTDLNDTGMTDYFWNWSAKNSYVLAHPAYHPTNA
jgi:hypothetical protein